MCQANNYWRWSISGVHYPVKSHYCTMIKMVKFIKKISPMVTVKRFTVSVAWLACCNFNWLMVMLNTVHNHLIFCVWFICHTESHRKISSSNDSGYNDDHPQNKSNGLPNVPESSEPKSPTKEGSSLSNGKTKDTVHLSAKQTTSALDDLPPIV